MPTPTDRNVMLPADHYDLLRKIAEAEERTLRAVIARALKMYAQKNAPKLLQKGGAR